MKKTENSKSENRLESEIRQKEKELAQLRENRNTATIENIATIDRDIVLMELQIKRLKDSKQIKELREKGNIPTDDLTRAKLHLSEMIDQVCQEKIDMNSDEPRIIASNRLAHIIERLEVLRTANEPSVLPFSATTDFTEQFGTSISEKAEKVKMAKEQLDKQDMEIQHLETLLNEAITSGNPEEIIAYSDSLETACKTREYLEPMVIASEQSETFPPGTISNEWKRICDIYRHEYFLRLEIINTAQEIHLRACDELIELANYLRALRSEIQRIGNENGSKDQIERYNAQIANGTDLLKIKEIKRDQYEGLNRYIYYDKERLL